MNHRFYCESCAQSFSGTGKKEKWHDPIVGAAWKLVADCPSCGVVANELKDKLLAKSSDSSASEGDACTTGACPFVS